MLFELASVFSESGRDVERRVRLSYRYSSIRIRQIEATFGFDNVIGDAAARGIRSNRTIADSPR